MATPGNPREPQITCDDFSEFQDTLKQMRKIDDRIVHALNTTIPTNSFATSVDTSKNCKALYEELLQSYSRREQAIKKCISEVSTTVDDLHKARAKDMDDVGVLQKLRKEQSRLRLIQAELNIEEVVKDRSLKVFHERCRHAYKPPKRT